MGVDHIDELLERYLHLLHEYTTLREQLSSLQTGIYQNIARANFAAERGMRFGQDYYDERMQASRKVVITSSGDQGTPAFAITSGSAEAEPSEEPAPSEEVGTTADGESRREDEALESSRKEKKKEQRQKDPLRWFGLLTPMPLRQAQAQSIEAVEQVVPKLVSIDAQMAQVEIEVRRARKKRAKAEAAAVKQEQEKVNAGAEITA
ncbi:hypothetical protein F5Y11DRAFT_335231 [Daldinia sp. FL1419]|nr:hypothetical protein F5Y11DRAFT_335231 [Daldinia sp. FL1419]